jgi:hypothetical protein
MTCRDVSLRLDDYVDGALTREVARLVETHLETCPACAAEERALRDLLDRAAKLPREIPPARDLWPGIAARVEGRKVASLRPRRGSGLLVSWPVGLAAAAALVGASSALTALLMRGSAPGLSPGGAQATLQTAALAGGPASFRAVEGEYEKAAAALLARLEERKGSLSPETLKAVEANLAVIDGALREVRAALEEDPGNPGLVRMLASTHQKKIDVLQRVARHPMSL